LSAGDALHLFPAILGLFSIFVTTDQFLLKAAKGEGLEAYNMENKDDAEKLIATLFKYEMSEEVLGKGVR